MRREIARWAAFAIIGTTTACGGDEAEQADAPAAEPAATADTGGNTPPPTAGGTQEGQQIFAGSGLCFTCHGSDATGTALGPDLTDGQWLWIDTAAGDLDVQLATLIRTGVSQPKEYPAPMPAMGGGQLSDAQIDAVAAYILSLNPQG